MAVQAKDGTYHHSAGKASLHDGMSGGKPKVTPMEKPAGAGGGKTHPAPSPHSIEDHVAQHGPAVEMHHHHDQATKKHHVTTHHGEGGKEMHHSEHDSHEAAHEHMGKALGIGAGEENEEAEPFAGEETPDEEMAEEHAGGHRIPGMA